jgi:Putative zinc- or iron-chelating domain
MSISGTFNKSMLRKLAIIFMLADNFVTNLVKKPFRTRWVLTGKCAKCGKCCQDIKLAIDPKLLSNAFIRELVVRWTSWVMGFDLKRIEYNPPYLVFGCKKLRQNGSCADYKWRPNVCRNYPLVDFFKEPALFGTCGYKAKLR